MGAVGRAGGVLLTGTAQATGLAAGLRAALTPWRKPWARHDPAKVLADLAIMLALGGDACSDVRALRAEPGVYALGGLGCDLVAHDRRVSRRC